MRFVALGFLCSLSLCIAADLNSRAPLWYRSSVREALPDGIRESRFVLKAIVDTSLKTSLEQLMALDADDEAYFQRGTELVRAGDQGVAERAACIVFDHLDARWIDALKGAATRWTRSALLWHAYAMTVATHGTDAAVREKYWALCSEGNRTSVQEKALAVLRDEMSRAGTEEDGQKLATLLPAGSDWREDPVIGRIRLHWNPHPDAVAFEILEKYENVFFAGGKFRSWSDGLYYAELLRYLTLGDQECYRPMLRRGLERPIFSLDSVLTQPELETVCREWLKERREGPEE